MFSCFEKYIQEAIDNNHDLKQANYRVEQFRYEISNQFAKQLPELSVGSNYVGASVPTGDSNVLIKRNSYILPFRAIYEPDFWFKNRDKDSNVIIINDLSKKEILLALLSQVVMFWGYYYLLKIFNTFAQKLYNVVEYIII